MRVRTILAPFSACVLLAACADRLPTAAGPAPADPTLQRFDCVASVRERSVSCTGAAAPGLRAEIFGGQNQNVRVSSTGVAYDPGQQLFSASISLTNLSPQILGTGDDVTADSAGIRIFFHDGPSATQGTGAVWVDNADGTGVFTAAGQPFFQYPGLLQPGQTTAAREWRWHVDPTVAFFGFTLLVDARLRPRVVIDEIMAHPSTASEAAGEWIEVYNGSIAPLRLDGWTLASGGDAPHTITGNVVVPTHGWLVLGASTDTAANGGAPVAHEWTGLDLANDTGDWVALRTPDGATADSVSWGAAPGETASPPPAGMSLALDSTSADNLHLGGAGSRWRPSPGFFGDGQFGSPGARNPRTLATVAVSAANGYSCALDAAGQAWCWGANTYGQLGAGTTGDVRLSPTPMVQTGLRFSSVAHASATTCLVEAGGGVYCTGAPLPDSASSWRSVPGLELAGSFTSVWGGTSICAVTPGDRPWCLGPNGVYWPRLSFAPESALPAGAYVSAASGRYHFCALNTAGAAYCAGDSFYGQLGGGYWGTAGFYFPAQLPSDPPYTAIAAGRDHTCGLASTGQAYCWGNDSTGAVGIDRSWHCAPPGPCGSPVGVSRPQPVHQPAGVSFSAITAGGDHTCALATDGRAYCWGGNDRGQLGDGTTTDRYVPVLVHAPASVRFSAIATGPDHTCALLVRTGHPVCWGANAAGGLGDGTQVQRLTPVPVQP